MHSRKKILHALLGVLGLVLLLIPMAALLSSGQDGEQAQDAEHIIQPMLELMASAPSGHADIPVEPMMELEDAWEIEDTREETERELVAGMLRGTQELGYDSERRTFYCTLGMDGGDDWPELALFAQAAGGEKNLRVAWIDDYSYDYRTDAISEGYRYELMAYTDTEYAYFGLVFTGLPIVTLHVHGGYETLGEEYTPARAAVSGEGYDAVSTCAQVHLRGGGFPQQYPKLSFRVELCGISDKGRLEKNPHSLLGMEADTDWLLISNVSDQSRVRNHMCWQFWKDWNADGRAFALLESRLVEVFVDDVYMGMYQLMQRVDADKEIERMGGSLGTDVGMRIITEMNIESRPYVNRLEDCSYVAELRYKPEYMSTKAALDVFEPYHTMNKVDQTQGYADNAAFEAAVLAHTDIREMLEYFVFAQAASFGHDNTYNNVYMWALRNGDNHVYYFSPWDMDRVFRPVFTDRDDQINLWYPQVVRMLDLNIGGAREILWEIWNEKKAQLLTEDALYQRFEDMEMMVNASGAYRRDMIRWEDEDASLNLAEYSSYMISHQNVVENHFMELWPIEGLQAE